MNIRITLLMLLLLIVSSSIYAIPFRKGDKTYTNPFFDTNKDKMYYVELNEVRSAGMGLQPVFVLLPPDYYKETKRYYPSIILLGGLSESLAGPLPSSLYWIHDCNLEEALIWMQSDSINAKAVWRMMPKDVIERYNKMLETDKLEDVILICPYTFAGLPEKFNKYIVEELISFMESKYRIASNREFRGINGVCLGGGMSFFYAFHYPELFSSVGGVQADIPDFTKHFIKDMLSNLDYIRKNIHVNLVESRGDSYLAANNLLVDRFKGYNMNCEYNVFLGGHGYAFYKAAGSKAAIYHHGLYFRKKLKEYRDDVALPVALSMLSKALN